MYTNMTPKETAKWESVCAAEKLAAEAHYAALMEALHATVPAEFLPTGEGFAISSTRHPGFSADHCLCSFYLDMGPGTMSTIVQFKFKKKTGRWALQRFTCSSAPPPFGIHISVRRFEAAVMLSRELGALQKELVGKASVPTIDSVPFGLPS